MVPGKWPGGPSPQGALIHHQQGEHMLPHNVKPASPLEATWRGLTVHQRSKDGPAACGEFVRWTTQLTLNPAYITCPACQSRITTNHPK